MAHLEQRLRELEASLEAIRPVPAGTTGSGPGSPTADSYRTSTPEKTGLDSPVRSALQYGTNAQDSERTKTLLEFTEASDWRANKLQSVLRATETEVYHIDQSMHFTSDHAAKLSDRVVKHQKQADKYDSEISKLRDEIERLKTENTHRDDTIRQQYMANAKWRDENEHLRTQISSISRLLSTSDKETAVQHLRDVLRYITERTARIQGQIAALEDTIQQQAVGLQSQKSVITDTHSQKGSVLQQLQSRLAAILADKDRYEQILETTMSEQYNDIDDLNEVYADTDRIKKDVDCIQDQLKQMKVQLNSLLNGNRHKLEEGKTLMERILKSTEGKGFHMDECMMLLKAAVINLDVDYRFIGHVKDKTNRFRDKEHVFKEAHNEVKVAVIQVIGPRKAHTGERWHITEDDVRARLDEHRVRNVFRSLQEMVVCYDMMNDQTKANLTTADEIVQNAEVLYAMARHTLRVENRRIEQAKARSKAADRIINPRLLSKEENRSRSGSAFVGSGPASSASDSSDQDQQQQQQPQPVRAPAGAINHTHDVTPSEWSPPGRRFIGRQQRETPPDLGSGSGHHSRGTSPSERHSSISSTKTHSTTASGGGGGGPGRSPLRHRTSTPTGQPVLRFGSRSRTPELRLRTDDHTASHSNPVSRSTSPNPRDSSGGTSLSLGHAVRSITPTKTTHHTSSAPNSPQYSQQQQPTHASPSRSEGLNTLAKYADRTCSILDGGSPTLYGGRTSSGAASPSSIHSNHVAGSSPASYRSATRSPTKQLQFSPGDRDSGSLGNSPTRHSYAHK